MMGGSSNKVVIKYIPLTKVMEWEWEENPKLHDVGGLMELIWEYGFLDPPKYDTALNALVYGNGRSTALMAGKREGRKPPRGVAVLEDGEWAVPVVFGADLGSKRVAEAFAIDHNNSTMAGGDFTAVDMSKMWDPRGYAFLLEKLNEDATPPKTLEGSTEAVLRVLAKQAEAEDAEDPMDGPDVVKRWEIPDAIWPTDNDLGIPLLDITLQAKALEAPVVAWGSIARTSRISGTWHFYVDDYRYTGLWGDPSPVVNTRCSAIVEPNYSVYEQMPAAVAGWQIYRKRWLARFYQSYGIRVFADLNVAENHAHINRLGIPAGWKAFATRGYTERLDATLREFGIACEISGIDNPLFVVYGGGRLVHEACKQRGWVWIAEQQSAQKKQLSGESVDAPAGLQ